MEEGFGNFGNAMGKIRGPRAGSRMQPVTPKSEGGFSAESGIRNSFDFRHSVFGIYFQASTISAGCGSRIRAPSGMRSATPSLSSASAAIQPLISTIGIPGPGCAAPPAR